MTAAAQPSPGRDRGDELAGSRVDHLDRLHGRSSDFARLRQAFKTYTIAIRSRQPERIRTARATFFALARELAPRPPREDLA